MQEILSSNELKIYLNVNAIGKRRYRASFGFGNSELAFYSPLISG